MLPMIQEAFIELIQHYADNDKLAEDFWKEIEEQYTAKTRHYHNLSHLSDLIRELGEVKEETGDWTTILFAVFYHDIIYKPSRNDNEERSAEVARKRLTGISYPAERV